VLHQAFADESNAAGSSDTASAIASSDQAIRIY
jgi:hypothetical protein